MTSTTQQPKQVNVEVRGAAWQVKTGVGEKKGLEERLLPSTIETKNTVNLSVYRKKLRFLMFDLFVVINS